jgi:hypothetical protein
MNLHPRKRHNAVRLYKASILLVVFFMCAVFTINVAYGVESSKKHTLTKSVSRTLRANRAAKYLVITSSSCEDIQPPKSWISTDNEGTLYDVVLFDYSVNHSCKSFVAANAYTTVLHMPKAFKWQAVHDFLLTPQGQRALNRYDAFLISDDDVDFPEPQPDLVFRTIDLCFRSGFYICQASLSSKSAINFAITEQVPQSGFHNVTAAIRHTKFVEQMAPIFTRLALNQFLPYFNNLTHAWGIDALWSDYSTRLNQRVGVLDSIAMDHMRPSGISSLYKRVGGLEQARADQRAFRNRFSLSDGVFQLMQPDMRGHGSVYTISN